MDVPATYALSPFYRASISMTVSQVTYRYTRTDPRSQPAYPGLPVPAPPAVNFFFVTLPGH
jgi:hypothetical protein